MHLLAQVFGKIVFVVGWFVHAAMAAAAMAELTCSALSSHSFL
jgi:hypothetical protein